MKVLAFVHANSSPAYHRVTLPLSLMDADVKVTNGIQVKDFEGVSVFYYNRVLPEEAINKIYELRKQLNFKIGVDLDDYWHLDNAHLYKNDYHAEKFASRQIRQIVNADFITVTHNRLANAVRCLTCSPVYILSNAIPETGQFTEVKTTPHPNNLIRVFWQGSNTHLPDIKQIEEAVKVLSKMSTARFIEMVLAGYITDGGDAKVWQRIGEIYTQKGALRHSLLSPLHYEYYYNLYSEADICLVPLRKSIFNSMKSNLKVLEAANLNLPVIASKVDPYLNLPIRYASNTKEWVLHIKELVMDANKRKDEGQRLNEYCKERFNFDKINTTRKQIFEYYSK